MTDGLRFDSRLSPTLDPADRAIHAGVFLARQTDGKVFVLAPLAPFAEGDSAPVYDMRRQVGTLRRFAREETVSELRRTCGLVDIESEAYDARNLQVEGPLAGLICRIESAFKREVSVFGASGATGVVTMAYRPVSYMLRKDAPVLLRDTLAVRFGESVPDTALQLGRLIVTADDSCPLGVILGGSREYCLVAPLSPLLEEGRFRLALVEQTTPRLILNLTSQETRRLLAEDGDRWSSPPPREAA